MVRLKAPTVKKTSNTQKFEVSDSATENTLMANTSTPIRAKTTFKTTLRY